ncbi:MAG: hypothetical protein SW833_12165 [Cyanobacteriota bacterium]|nr:hypothetical protein [Cyanobacteriota bacterium]
MVLDWLAYRIRQAFGTVKMLCGNIYSAVITKLSDRGSVESVGVVTDVGLFLSLLVQQLEKLTNPYSVV